MNAGTAIFFIAFCTGIIFLQIYLSRQSSKWPGLILPAIFIFFSLIAVLSVSVFSTITTLKGETINLETGEMVESSEESAVINKSKVEVPQLIFTMVFTLFYMNIPTYILFAIYFGCRSSLKRNAGVEKMSVQDL